MTEKENIKAGIIMGKKLIFQINKTSLITLRQFCDIIKGPETGYKQLLTIKPLSTQTNLYQQL